MAKREESQSSGIEITIFERVKRLSLPLGKYIVVGGAMEAHGIRKANDVDLIVTDELFDQLVEAGWTQYDLTPKDKGRDGNKRKVNQGDVDVMTEFSWNEVTIAETKDLITRAEIIEGVPFVPLELLLQWKEISEREKDATDAALIRDYLETQRQANSQGA